jgi:hypothetical protein
MKSIKLVKIKVSSLAEIFQSLDIKFAWVNKKYKEVSVPAKCRDFLGDCIYSKKSKNPVNIYGFRYNYKNTPFDDCRFSLLFPNSKSYNNLINNLPYLHEREKKAGVKLTKVYATDAELTLVVEGSNYWSSDIWKISLYTYYLKLISYTDPTKPKNPENTYAAKFTSDKEEKMLSGIKRKTTIMPKDYHVAHNYFGFYSVLNGYEQVSKLSKKLGVI